MSRSGTTTSDRAGGGGSSRAGAEARPRRRPTARRRPRRDTPAARRRRLLVRGGVLAAVLGLSAWLLWGSPVLAVATVRVDGAGTLTAAEVVDVAGIDEGTPLLRVDVDAAEARVARLPQVADVEVTRGWPRSVVVTVVERVPVAVVEESGARSLVDADGVLFDTVTGYPPVGVVPLEVADPGPEDPATRAALAALVALPEDVRVDLADARATSAEDVTLTLEDGTTVLWGSAERAGDKADALVALLVQLESGALEPAGTIDVSTPAAVVLR
ncbi:cell division protein FtsQ [Geodermatophilus africanus]|uniref:Cell division protein FtsQ n=1 Tax=Geodermatophilus africanus TaxID=1137993 RepID=A0A1H3HVF9_9ACTN|nr:FtsQ-type POTRA domain-containing protein [Geodermatophilus africanus]SDY19215.1 cell division protein FtsQ [Geodermatophilus africanus]